MKAQLVWVLCLLVLRKISGDYGTSRYKKTGNYGLQFRSSVFSSISEKHPSLTTTYAARLILCAARCMADDKCVGVKAEEDGKKLSTLMEISAAVGYIWKRKSETKTETSKGVKKKALPRLLSAHVSPKGWTVEERGMKVKMSLFDQSSEKTNLWKPKVAAYSRRGEPVTAALLASSATVILHLHKPGKLCAGELFGKLRCMFVPPNWDAIGGMQMHLGYLYVSAGKSIYMVKIKAYSTIRKLTDYKIVKRLPDTPSEIATDELGGKSMIFWSVENKRRIGRAQTYRHPFKLMAPLNINCNHFTFTIDSIGHVIYVLTDDRRLRLLRYIHASTPPTGSTVLTVLSFKGPITKLLFSMNTIHLIWPDKNDVVSFDVQEKLVYRRRLTNLQISPPKRVITIIPQ